MSFVPGAAFSTAQSSSPVMPGMFTSRTITSGLVRRESAGAQRATVRLRHLDVRDLEGRPQQRAERRVVVDQQDAQDPRPPFPVPETIFGSLSHRT